ncbi:MAG: ABC transporter ATP-binding protein/permease [Clostridiales bacterium]|nr:ABC transporter ATP-binding protein/permease [Clostridiales bacterium]
MEDLETSALQEEEFQHKVDFKLWRKLVKYALRSKKTVIFVIAANILVAAIDIVYPLLSRYAIDNIIVGSHTERIVPFAIVYVAFIILQAFGVLSFIMGCGRLEMKIAFDIRQDAFTKLQELPFSYYDKTAVGYIMARMVADVANLSELIAWSLVDILWSGAYVLGIVIMMLVLNWKLALIVIAVLPPLAVICVYFQKKILKYFRDVKKQNSRITGALNEGIMGAVTTKTLVREEKNSEEFRAETGRMRKSAIRASVLSAMFTPIVMCLGAIGTGLALYAGGMSVTGKWIAFGTVTVGTLATFISYSQGIFDPIQQLAGIFAEMQSAQASAERVIHLIETPCEIADTPEVIEKYGTSFEPKRENWEELKGDVRFEDVSFAYKGGEKVLEHFDLDVKAGQNIALVGETGAGKSTIVNLVCRFYEPTAGRILVDGVDYRERSQLWLQDRLGYVLQQPYLFSTTIKENIRYGRPEATEEEVIAAAKLVHADEFIKKLEKGYDTEVGEGGGRLSTGQKQLISFARVILADPRIFVLDEATSSIDTETEQLIQSAITKVLKNRTSFIVAHRLSTIRSADRILVIRDGRITESGTHAELIKLHGYYYDLYTTQFKKDALSDVLGA